MGVGGAILVVDSDFLIGGDTTAGSDFLTGVAIYLRSNNVNIANHFVKRNLKR